MLGVENYSYELIFTLGTRRTQLMKLEHRDHRLVIIANCAKYVVPRLLSIRIFLVALVSQQSGQTIRDGSP